jgi:hypothetical protein
LTKETASNLKGDKKKGTKSWNSGIKTGLTPWNKGKSSKPIQEKKPRIAWNKGMKGQYTQTPESNIKRSNTQKGISRPEEVIQKIKDTKARNKLSQDKELV